MSIKTTSTQYPQEYLGSNHYPNVGTMKELYDKAHLIPTSENADKALIRSHIAYWMGQDKAKRAIIAPSRGHSYKVSFYSSTWEQNKITITDYYDHREGVKGLH